VLVAVACGGADHKGDRADTPDPLKLECPAGATLHGKAPPDGKLLFCADLSREGMAARDGPVVDWGCGRCRRGGFVRGAYARGRKHGAWTLYSGAGKRLGVTGWKAGKRVGDSAGWYPDGTEFFHLWFDQNGQRQGVEWRNYRDGKREYEGSWADDRRDGRWRRWSRGGALVSDSHYKRGERAGTWRTYDSSGQVTGVTRYEAGRIVAEGNFVGGRLVMTTMDAEGEALQRWTERNGRRHGKAIEFHHGTHAPRRVTVWVDGVQTGPVTLYRKDRTKIATGVLKAGVLQCGWRLFDAEGAELTRGPPIARRLTGRARELGLSPDPCTWDLRAAVTLHREADPLTTVRLARWWFERAALPRSRGRLPAAPATPQRRLATMLELWKKAEQQAAAHAFAKAGLLHVAALLEAHRALGGKLLELPENAVDPAPPRWPGPAPDAAMAARYRAAVAANLPALRALLFEETVGGKPVRKLGRVTLGRIGVNRLNLRALAKRVK